MPSAVPSPLWGGGTRAFISAVAAAAARIAQPAYCAGPKRLIILSKTLLGLAKGICWHLVANRKHLFSSFI